MSERTTPDINWTIDGRKDLLFAYWQSGLSTTEIAANCSLLFRQPVSKNAVIGKVGRFAKSDPNWDKRPSPILRRNTSLSSSPVPPRISSRGSKATLPPLPSAVRPLADLPPAAKPTTHWDYSLSVAQLPIFAQPALASVMRQCEARNPDAPLRRRDGSGCLFPKGDPGSPNFRFCDENLYHLNKPYCATCAGNAYVKLNRINTDAE